jgi:hypothetical protein
MDKQTNNKSTGHIDKETNGRKNDLIDKRKDVKMITKKDIMFKCFIFIGNLS